MSREPATSEEPLDRWLNFLDATTDRREPRDNLIRALPHVAPDGVALDLGCGCGHDTIAMLQRGLHVVALDHHPEAVRRTRDAADAAGLAGRLEARVCAFEMFEPAPESFDLIYASFSLPFCEPPLFPSLWSRLRSALRTGGVLAVQLFGERDQWAGEPGHLARNFHTAREIDELTSGLERLHFEEVERDGVTATGREKHWHVFHLVLRRGDDVSAD